MALDDTGKHVIARAAAVLSALQAQPGGMSLAQIAQATGLPRTTVHRLVSALEAQQLVLSGPRGVTLGPALVRLAASAHTDVVALARPHLEALGRRTRETVDLCVYRGTHSVLVDQFASDQELRVVSPVGTAFAVHCTAHGKALLAALADSEVAERLPDELERRTATTLGSLPALLAELAQVRQHGVAVDREEHAAGVCGLGVHLYSGLVERYAIALAVPALRFEANRAALQAALLQCKAEIEARLGV